MEVGGGEEISSGSWYVSQCVTSQSNSHHDWPGAPTLQYLISHISYETLKSVPIVVMMWRLINSPASSMVEQVYE